MRPPRRCAHATWPAPLRRAEAQSGPDQRREHHACGRTAAGLAEAQKGFRRVKGNRDLPKLIAAIRRELNPAPTEEAAAARA
jgi:hypothetical protein